MTKRVFWRKPQIEFENIQLDGGIQRKSIFCNVIVAGYFVCMSIHTWDGEATTIYLRWHPTEPIAHPKKERLA